MSTHPCASEAAVAGDLVHAAVTASQTWLPHPCSPLHLASGLTVGQDFQPSSY